LSLNIEQMKSIVEAALLVSDHPLNIEQLVRLFEDAEEVPPAKMMQQIIKLLIDDYKDRGIQLNEVASGFRFQARADLAPW
jgi:segregation and condensation protein B